MTEEASRGRDAEAAAGGPEPPEARGQFDVSGGEDRSPAARTGLDNALDRIGDRWSLLVVEALLDGPKRFSDLQQSVPGVAANILTARLRRLERDRLVIALQYSDKPVRYEYQVTPEGAGLAGALRLLAHWGNHAGGAAPDDVPVHSVCATPLEVRWYCPTCQRATDGADDDVAWY
ncbi:MAG TPA: helix-turn-helix domain-containing protein [Acidimicrobiales bacterium]|nr:helix-turn-helix domain-containing protein [Acidimicrobiales bacterium]